MLVDRDPHDADLITGTLADLRNAPIGDISRLSVFWGSRPALYAGHDDGRFPAHDRLDLAEHGRLLYGTDMRDDLARPSVAELVTESACFASAALATAESIEHVRHPDMIVADPRRYSKLVLMPIRLLYTAETGNLGITEPAVEHYLDSANSSAAALVRAAYEYRSGSPLPLPTLLALAQAHLSDLHRHYIERQIAALADQREHGPVIDRLHRWKSALGSPATV